MFDADNDGVDEVAYIARTDDNDGDIVKLFDALTALQPRCMRTGLNIHSLNLLILIKMVIWMWSLEIQVRQLI